MVNRSGVARLVLALGANQPGTWGAPHETLARALSELQAAGIGIVRVSHLYKTPPAGGGRQPSYLNAVAVASSGGLGPTGLLRLLKSLERRAGRRVSPPLRPRPLDIDLLDLGGRRLNWPARSRRRPGLVLPHPLLDQRAFVLIPLLEVAPHWSHPVLGVRARTLLARLGRHGTRGIRKLARRSLAPASAPARRDCA
jgi:2-amino-4-hydroxy-6-hydroxymethyldihydropteridine diphosphokinase